VDHIKFLLDLYPAAATHKDDYGCTPIHYIKDHAGKGGAEPDREVVDKPLFGRGHSSINQLEPVQRVEIVRALLMADMPIDAYGEKREDHAFSWVFVLKEMEDHYVKGSQYELVPLSMPDQPV
jgi:hypothetical protein